MAVRRAIDAAKHPALLLVDSISGLGCADYRHDEWAALAAILSPVVGGWIIDVTGNWNLPFIGSMGLMIVGAVCAFAVKPEQKF